MAVKSANGGRKKKPIPPSEEEIPNTIMPDPEAETAAQNPSTRRSGMPPYRVTATCDCGVVMEMYVDNLDAYPVERLQMLFRERGSSYQPSICKWCINRMPKNKLPQY